MEGTNLAGIGVSVAYLTKKIEHIGMNSTVRRSSAGRTNAASNQ